MVVKERKDGGLVGGNKSFQSNLACRAETGMPEVQHYRDTTTWLQQGRAGTLQALLR
jgi:hypothetical protein